MTTKLLDLELELVRETEKAYGVAEGTTGGKDKKLKLFWLPKSQVEKHEEGNKTIFVVPEWLATDKGLI